MSALSVCEFIPQVPPEIKAGRSVILKDLDTYLYDHCSDEIIGEIHQHNDWAKLSEVFKFPNSRSIKLVFTHSALVEMCLSRGLNMFFMHVPGSHIKKKTHVELITYVSGVLLSKIICRFPARKTLLIRYAHLALQKATTGGIATLHIKNA